MLDFVFPRLTQRLQMSDPKSDTSTTLSAIAVRLALKMGLDREQATDKISLFEQEMRIRLWWQICSVDVLARHAFVGRDGNNTDGVLTSNVRLPLNVNDAELHPDMIKPPVEYPRATEMIYVLVRYEGAIFGQRLRASGRLPSFDSNPFDDLEKLMTDKYLCHCDSRIPLQHAAQSMIRFALTSIRYRVACHKATSLGGNPSSDILLDKAVELLDVERASRSVPFATQLLWSISPVDLDALVHILSYLRHCGNGERSARAWKEVVHFWDQHVDSAGDEEMAGQNSFFVNLADLTLEAWEERRKELAATQGVATAEQMKPVCITKLQRLRHKGATDNIFGSTTFNGTDYGLSSQAGWDAWDLPDIPSNLFTFGNDLLYDFGFWSEFSQT
jgi:hypothetical protein